MGFLEILINSPIYCFICSLIIGCVVLIEVGSFVYHKSSHISPHSVHQKHFPVSTDYLTYAASENTLVASSVAQTNLFDIGDGLAES